MPIDPRLQTFLEQTGLMKKPGSAPRRPEVLLAEERESAKQVIVAPSNMLEPVDHIENCYTATSWMAIHETNLQGDATRMTVGGESGGANYAAAIALMSRHRGSPTLKFQLLICPAADFRVTTDSWKDYDGYMILKEE